MSFDCQCQERRKKKEERRKKRREKKEERRKKKGVHHVISKQATFQTCCAIYLCADVFDTFIDTGSLWW